MIKRNPKQEGSNLWDCKTQVGNCPMDCNQCFANRPGAAYIPMDKQILPTVEEVGSGIVRANCLHDSNIRREELIEHCKRYEKVFYNTSVPKLDFPGPVVFTANAKEEVHFTSPNCPSIRCKSNLMFVRLRVSSTNLPLIRDAVYVWTREKIPVVLTFMAYYNENKLPDSGTLDRNKCYAWKKRHVNSYFCPTKNFMTSTLEIMKKVGGRLVTMCGTLDSHLCKDCRNCETYYYQTIKHMRENESTQ